MRRSLLFLALLSFAIVGIASASSILSNSDTSIDVRFDGYSCGQTHTFSDDTGQTLTGSTSACPGPSAVPSIPTGFTAVAGNGQATLTWSANPTADQVDLYQSYKNDAFDNLSIPCSTQTCSYAVTGLTNGTAYSFRVSAHNVKGYGMWTAPISVTPASPASLGTSLPARMPESVGPIVTVAAGGSVANAVNAASSGTTIQLHGGNYGLTSVSHKWFSETNPVTITSYPGERAVFVGTTAYANALDFEDVSGIRFRGITVDAPYDTGLKLEDAQNVEIDGIIARNTGTLSSTLAGGQGILVGGGPASGYTNSISKNVQILNSDIYNVGSLATASNALREVHGIYMCSAHNATWPTPTGCDGFVVANNTIHANWAGYGIQLGSGAMNGFVVNNTIDHTGFNSAGVDKGSGTESGGCGIIVWSSQNNIGRTKNDVIANNIFANGVANAVCSSANTADDVLNNVVKNNLAYNNGLHCTGTGCTITYNPLYGTHTLFNCGATPCPGENLPNGNPLFVTPGAMGNYHLQVGSPALGKSLPAFTPPFDKDGVARPSAPALGAFG